MAIGGCGERDNEFILSHDLRFAICLVDSKTLTLFQLTQGCWSGRAMRSGVYG